MNKSTWQRAKVIFYEARDLAIDKRAAFLNDKCSEAEELRSEVEKLLASYDSGFLEETAFGAAEVLAGMSSLIRISGMRICSSSTFTG